eukprot:8598175-Alexandrium_andersonii.AAC.1
MVRIAVCASSCGRRRGMSCRFSYTFACGPEAPGLWRLLEGRPTPQVLKPAKFGARSSPNNKIPTAL